MAGSNFIGVNLCFATGYGQTYIVDPLSYTYNVGDYVSISGSGGYYAVQLTGTTGSPALFSGTGTPYATFLESLQESNRLQTGFATDFCTARISGFGIGNNCGTLYNQEASWSYTAATNQIGFVFYTSAGTQSFYPVDSGGATDVAYKLGFSGSGFTNDCYPLTSFNGGTISTNRITGATLIQQTFTNCTVCESTIFRAKG
jgi:hypothetical protein